MLPVRDVFFGLWVDVLFGQTKVDDVDGVLPLASWPPDQEVLWLHVSVYQALCVDVLHPCNLGAKRKDQICMHLKELQLFLETCCACLVQASYQLYGYHEDGLEGEGSVTEIK